MNATPMTPEQHEREVAIAAAYYKQAFARERELNLLSIRELRAMARKLGVEAALVDAPLYGSAQARRPLVLAVVAIELPYPEQEEG